MGITNTVTRRVVLAGGFALAIAVTPAAVAVVTSTPPSHTACANGETEDNFTAACTPDVVPNTTAGLPSVDGIPCTGANSGQCFGLSEDAPSYTPPSSTVGSDPTIHGQLG
jgi:hypothetical protein